MLVSEVRLCNKQFRKVQKILTRSFLSDSDLVDFDPPLPLIVGKTPIHSHGESEGDGAQRERVMRQIGFSVL